MELVKIFIFSRWDVNKGEKEINKWLEEMGKSIEITQRLQSFSTTEEADDIVISIFYRVK